MRLLRLPLLVWIGVIAAPAAHACNIDDPIEIIQGEIGDFSKVRAVVLARVSRVVPATRDQVVSRFNPQQQDQIWKHNCDYNWDAVFDYQKTLRGFADNRLFVVTQRALPGYCDVRRPPAIGDLRVLYIRSDNIVYDVDPKFVQLDDPNVPLKAPYSVQN